MDGRVLAELDALRALARALVHGDAEADDLLHDTAIVALAHPAAIADDRPLRPWLAAVLRNRWRMDRRGDARRRAREEVAARAADASAPAADELLARARTLERLATALVALAEPFRATVILRYLDGQSAAAIARALGVPTGTVRWRLKTGLARLRTALDDRDARPRWQRALVPVAGAPFARHAMQGVVLVKAKLSVLAVLAIVVLLLGGAVVYHYSGRGGEVAAPVAAVNASGGAPAIAMISPPRSAAIDPNAAPGAPRSRGQARATVVGVDLAGGAISGRVVNWSSGDGVADADLTFTSDAGASTIRTQADGSFRLVPPAPGSFALATASAIGFLPYAPELAHSSVRVATVAHREVRGVTVFLFPALDYHGRVVDAAGAPVPGATIHLLGTPAGEQAIDRLATDWIADRDGRFTFHAADDAVLEATSAGATPRRGWARLDGGVAITKQLVITLGDAPARTATITGTVVDAAGAPLADVLVRADPDGPEDPAAPRAAAFATTAADGAFTLAGLATGAYDLGADADTRAPIVHRTVQAGATGVVLAMDTGVALTGTVVTADGQPAPAYTLLVSRRAGVRDELVASRSIVDARGQFAVHVEPGDYQLIASAAGWAPSARTPATAAAGAAAPITITLTAGATLRGTVVSTVDNAPVPYARVAREGGAGGASAQPANAGTVTRADGSFELAGLPPGALTISIGADSFHPRLESGLDATDGGELGPITIALAPLAPGESPTLELVGIGVKLSAGDASVHVDAVVPGGGAAAAGIVVGDAIVSVDGTAVGELGMDGTISHIRGAVGTTVVIGVQRGADVVQLTVERRKLRA